MTYGKFAINLQVSNRNATMRKGENEKKEKRKDQHKFENAKM
jgi:hypothetical protein